ncbi:MAG: leucine-rich repeat domain-containing protein [Planctomycetaceae bacterium]
MFYTKWTNLVASLSLLVLGCTVGCQKSAEQSPAVPRSTGEVSSSSPSTPTVSVPPTPIANEQQFVRSEQDKAVDMIKRVTGKIDVEIPIVNVDLNHTSVSDADLEGFSNLSTLKQLYLRDTKITDAGLVHLKNCSGLEHLHLNSAPGVTDAGLVNVKDLKNLRRLDIGGTAVIGEGLVYIGDLPHLEEMDIQASPFSDVGLKYLEAKTSLRYVNLAATQISEDGLNKLRAARPDLKIGR